MRGDRLRAKLEGAEAEIERLQHALASKIGPDWREALPYETEIELRTEIERLRAESAGEWRERELSNARAKQAEAQVRELREELAGATKFGDIQLAEKRALREALEAMLKATGRIVEHAHKLDSNLHYDMTRAQEKARQALITPPAPQHVCDEHCGHPVPYDVAQPSEIDTHICDESCEGVGAKLDALLPDVSQPRPEK